MSHAGFHPEKQKLRDIGVVHYAVHWLYSYIEPKIILKLVDYLLSKKWMTETSWGRKTMLYIAKASRDLPHGIVITLEAALRVIDYLDRLEGPDNGRFALGPCLCQLATCKWEEPLIKDIQFLYAKDIFMSLKLGYTIASAGEVKAILRKCNALGYIHCLEMCRQSGKWLFCICNCEPRICAPTRVFLLTGEMMWKGPEICVSDRSRCIGEDKCGKCVARCMFSAIVQVDGRFEVNSEKCMGCGLCVSTCIGRARRMMPRHDYAHDHQVPAGILLG